LRQSELRWRTMTETLPNLVWTALRDGKCDWLSSQWHIYTGLPEKELVGFLWLERVIHPEDRERAIVQWNRAVESGNAYDVEYRIRRHDGEYRWFKTRGVPIPNEQGRAFSWVGTCTDIHDVKQAEAALQRVASIVESSDDAIISKDLNGIIASWNKGAERVFGYTAEEVIGKPVTILMPPERINEEPGILDRIRHGERIDHYETVRRRKDGSLFNISLTVSPIRDAQGKVIGASKVARDITDRVRAKEQLEQTVTQRTASLREAMDQMEEFSYSVSHDLRSPVRAMQGYASALAEDYGARLDDKGRDYLDRIIQASSRMQHLIQDVLTYSRLSRMDMEIHAVALEPLIRGLVRHYPELDPAQADISIASNMPRVLAHEPSLGQAIANLLSNAVKFVAAGVRPSVQVTALEKAGKVSLRVKDNGIGIKPQYHHRLFGMFERIHPIGTYEGTGIGLAIVRKTVERMGGTAGVESDGSHGATFWIELPAAPASAVA